MKNSVSGMLGRVALTRTDVSEERRASVIRVIIGELGTKLALLAIEARCEKKVCFGC
jgi:hypothetical protein